MPGLEYLEPSELTRVFGTLLACALVAVSAGCTTTSTAPGSDARAPSSRTRRATPSATSGGSPLASSAASSRWRASES